ncbi:MAG: peptide chain release factor-like protein [Deltaproteobacteria bacterium]
MHVSPEKLRAMEERMRHLGIFEQDLEESFIRSGGAGGQKVNKAASCVYLRHRPTGLQVKCQISRSQSMNRFLARRILCDKYELQILKIQTEKAAEAHRVRKQKKRRSRKAKQKMLEEKRKRGEKKALRKGVTPKGVTTDEY